MEDAAEQSVKGEGNVVLDNCHEMLIKEHKEHAIQSGAAKCLELLALSDPLMKVEH